VQHAHTKPVLALDVSPDGTMVVSGARDGTLVAWGLQDGVMLRSWGHLADSVSAVAFLVDGQRVLTACIGPEGRVDALDTTLSVWNALDGSLVAKLHGHADNVHGVTAAGSVAVSSSRDFTVRVWDLDLLAERLEAKTDLLHVWSVRDSGGGRRTAVTGADDSVRRRAVDDRAWIVTIPSSPHTVTDALTTPDGQVLVSGGHDHTVRVWHAGFGAQLSVLTGHSAGVFGIDMTGDGERVVSVGQPYLEEEETGQPELKVWNLSEARCTVTIPTGGAGLAGRPVRVTPDGRAAVCACDDSQSAVWHVDSGKLLRHWDGTGGDLVSLAVSPDGRLGAVGDEAGVVVVRRLGDGRPVASFEAHAGYVWGLQFTRDGRCLFSASDDGSAKLWHVAGGTRLIAAWHTKPWVTAVEVLGATYRCQVGLSTGDVPLLDLVNGPTPGVPFVTMCRPWTYDLAAPRPGGGGACQIIGQREATHSAHCPWCDQRFAPVATVERRVITLSTLLGSTGVPCLDHPDEAWEDPDLLSGCPRCGRPVRFNPFVVGAAPERSPARWPRSST
jgi:hypothetical protein